MSAEKKPTPAQRKWLKAIAAGKVHRAGHSWVNGMRGAGSSTYVMTLTLRDAGWIDQDPAGTGPFHERYRLILTDAGRAAIGAATPPAAQGEQDGKGVA